ncbi:hypothetical protein A2926_02330 [Candidatus Giovannonibacteria bacterium RIFCSPLOWO2_01_FULL_44_40]|uniref:Uncharacterized protein n=1 Tax=Candidatus Giovannonibacteria bacterium RIFCSPHIGHO2_01_FULL_45_23 TaxID=1798325 RepID=A0A1F5VHH9_9BACT|nr:MAG: hypothetical protein A2834_02445 [Candidatus Giovannonibacteria bacterium RIFCSPHIGHO2_01_FULL_45_23]OGF75570.1 MAG: hypothetical protein A3C77_01930 [Candidatus Giovannonibacteria bacterium RIFCSPHIGHO2_02_FULL_45_13]OGF79988.1 MAG: hypothetical protein A2926_02330 [Candidatus Giovannonibacteria bacterium RIFCSPLOWO2_01_FULL_44_40]
MPVKKIDKPKGNINYDLLKKKTDLIGFCTDFYLLVAMKHIADMESEGGRAFIKWREEFVKNIGEVYEEVVEELEKIFLAYFPLAVASELQNKDEIKTPDKKVEKIAWTLLEGIPDDDDKLLQYLEKNVATCESALSFFKSAQIAFGKLKWESGFGGKKWEQIADKAAMRLAGKIDKVTFVDTAFNIEHHGGHIFDKHENIRCDGRRLRAVLAIKRDETISRMEKLIGKKYASSSVKKLFQIGTKFNWWKEEAE